MHFLYGKSVDPLATLGRCESFLMCWTVCPYHCGVGNKPSAPIVPAPSTLQGSCQFPPLSRKDQPDLICLLVLGFKKMFLFILFFPPGMKSPLWMI